MLRHFADRIWHLAARPPNACVIEENDFASRCERIRHPGVPVVERTRFHMSRIAFHETNRNTVDDAKCRLDRDLTQTLVLLERCLAVVDTLMRISSRTEGEFGSPARSIPARNSHCPKPPVPLFAFLCVPLADFVPATSIS